MKRAPKAVPAVVLYNLLGRRNKVLSDKARHFAIDVEKSSGGRFGSDPQAIYDVWDEFVGLWITLLPALLAPWWAVLAGFVLFRLFDVWKPWPTRQ